MLIFFLLPKSKWFIPGGETHLRSPRRGKTHIYQPAEWRRGQDKPGGGGKVSIRASSGPYRGTLSDEMFVSGGASCGSRSAPLCTPRCSARPLSRLAWLAAALAAEQTPPPEAPWIKQPSDLEKLLRPSLYASFKKKGHVNLHGFTWPCHVNPCKYFEMSEINHFVYKSEHPDRIFNTGVALRRFGSGCSVTSCSLENSDCCADEYVFGGKRPQIRCCQFQNFYQVWK